MRQGRPDSVDSTVVTRIRHALQPDWVHSVRTRRVAAGALVVLAAAAALRSEPGGAHSDAVVAVRDLSPGVPVTPDDVRVENRLAAMLPDGTQADVATVVGAPPAGPIRRGEVITDVRMLGPALTEAVAGPNGRVVPLQLAQDAILDVLREGDVVDVIAAPRSAAYDDAGATARTVATDAVVVLISPDAGGLGGADDRVVLVALPAAAATAVATASLAHTITVTLH
jgi:hypothetical protein